MTAIRLPSLGASRQDLRYALRSFRRAPGFTIVAVLTLTLGIGATTALFTVAYGVLLQPLPYKDADRLVVINAEQDFEGTAQPVPTRFQWDAMTAWPASGRSFERVGFFSREAAALSGAESSELIDIAVVSGEFFEILGGEFLLGRGLLPADDAHPVAVVSEALWRREYGSAPDILRKQVVLTGQSYTIVGVVHDSFQIPQHGTDAWIPAGFSHARSSTCCGFTAIARIRPDVSATVVREEAATIVDTLAAQFPRALAGTRVRVVTLRDSIVGDTRPALLALGAAVALLFLLACANVANLLLARNTARAYEIDVRRALGASRARLIMQGFAESLLLSAGGGVLGTALAFVSVRILKVTAVEGLPRLDAIRVDSRLLAAALAISATCAVVVALLPSIRFSDTPLSLAIRPQGSGGDRRSRAVLRALTIAQLGISVVLLVGSVLLGRSLIALMRTDMGITPANVATASLNLAMNRRLTDIQQADLVDRVVQRISGLPGVSAAGVGTARPPDSSRMIVTLNRGSDAGARASYRAAAVPVTPGYFRALGVRVERGRLFTEADDRQAPPVVILSADTARRLFGAREPLGQTIDLPVLRDGKTGGEKMTVVGVTSNVKYGGLDRAADDVLYRPFAQQTWRSVFLVVRTVGDPEVLASQLRREIAAVDRGIVVDDVTTLDAVLSDITARPRFRTLLLAALSAMAFLIATVGLYGVVAFSVSRRAGEIGIRMALGADRRRIRLMVLREGMILALAGGAVGLAGAWALGRLLTTLLYGIAPTDPVSYALATMAVIGTGLLASSIPADRAARTDTRGVLRAE